MTRGTVSYIGQRLILIAVTTVLVSSIVFLLLHQIPGSAFINETRQTPESLAANLHHYGLDLPLYQQYTNWFTGVFAPRGPRRVAENRGVLITPLLLREASVSATVGSTRCWSRSALGLILGIIAALRQNTWVDYVAVSASVVGYSIPSFVLAISASSRRALLLHLDGRHVLLHSWVGQARTGSGAGAGPRAALCELRGAAHARKHAGDHPHRLRAHSLGEGSRQGVVRGMPA